MNLQTFFFDLMTLKGRNLKLAGKTISKLGVTAKEATENLMGVSINRISNITLIGRPDNSHKASICLNSTDKLVYSFNELSVQSIMMKTLSLPDLEFDISYKI